MSSSDLVQRLSQKDPTALEEFYKQYRAPVYALARRIVVDEWDAEEVLQDVVWTVFRKADTFRGDAEFQRWVYRVTRNASLMLLRKRKRIPTPVEDSDMEAFINATNHYDDVHHPEQAFVHQQAVNRMNHELDRLDPVNQTLFNAMDIHGRSKEEVSLELGLSVSAVKARLHRIRKTLRQSVDNVLVPA